MSKLLVRPRQQPAEDGSLVLVTPESAGWGHVGFEVITLAEGGLVRRSTGDRELCVVVIEGSAHVLSEHGDWHDLGGRSDPFSGMPDAAYLPPRTNLSLQGGRGGAELGLCFAPAASGAAARVLPGADVDVEVRGYGAQERRIHPILMGDREADSLLVCEVLTPEGHWSSYPPHKHDRDALPEESLLEETYYHRVTPAPRVCPAARLHGRRHARRVGRGTRSRRGAGAARLPHGLCAPRLCAVLPECDGRPRPGLGDRE